MKKIAIIGAGGFAKEVKILIDNINKFKPTYNLIGFFDDKIEEGRHVNGVTILGKTTLINDIDFELCIALGIGDPATKYKMIKNINNKKISFPTLIHPSVIVSNDEVSIGKGVIICAGNIITCNIELKDFVTLNLSCTIGHDTVIDEFCSFMPSVNISGEVKIERQVYVGTGAKIINQIKIGEKTIIGAGSIILKSIPPNCTALGIPCRPIKFH